MPSSTYVKYQTIAHAANKAMPNVLAGTPVTPLLPTNTCIFFNSEQDGDLAIVINKGGNSQAVFWADASAGDTAVMASSGASVDHYIAGTKVLDHASGAFAFQESTTLSSTGTLTINAFSLGGKLTAGATEIEGSSFDINGGTIDGVTITSPALSGTTTGTFTIGGTVTIDAFTLGGDITVSTSPYRIVATTGGLGIGLTASAPAPDGGAVHIWDGTAGSITASALSVLVLERNTDVALSMLAPDGAGRYIYFTAASADRLGYISYDAAEASNMRFAVKGTQQAQWFNGAFTFNVSTTLSSQGTLTIEADAFGSGAISYTGTLAVTGSRVTQSYHTNITSTNAVTVDSSIESKIQETMRPYRGNALDVIAGMEFVEFQHHHYLDHSDKFKLGVVAESIGEHLVLSDIEKPGGGYYPGVNLYALDVLNAKGIQEAHSKIQEMEREITELKAQIRR